MHGRLILTRQDNEQTTLIVGGKEVTLTLYRIHGKIKCVWQAPPEVRIVRTEIIKRGAA